MLAVQDAPAGLDAARWHERLLAVVQKQVRPAVERYRDVLRDEVAPAARPDERCGLTWLPDGDEVYARATALLHDHRHLTQEIHEIGLRQVAALAEEYSALGDRGRRQRRRRDRSSRALRDDPALHHTSGEQIVADSKAAMAKARAAMGGLVRAAASVGLRRRGDHQRRHRLLLRAAQGRQPRRDVLHECRRTRRAGGASRSSTTSYHEGIPGHHLQLAIAGELDGIPEFRKRLFIAAYGEGWGLYTERLADEMGLYSTPLDRMGMLSADSMRACRLVVDTGMHALGWSRRQAVEYMLENSPMREGHITAEVDRYVVTPGQALSYMIGRLEIQRIRA